MTAAALHLARIAKGWLEAWRNVRDNPLLEYWPLAERRRVAQIAWWARSPGLVIGAIAASLGVTGVLVYQTIGVIQAKQQVLSQAHIISLVNRGTAILALGAFIFSLFWLMTRMFSTAQLALGFLEMHPRQRLRQSLDDMLAISRLSEQEVLIGIGFYCLRRLFPAVAVVSVFAALLVAGRIFLEDSAGGLTWSGLVHLGLVRHAMIFGSIFVRLVIGGCLAAIAFIYLLVTLSLAERSGLLPSIGGIMHTLLQLILILGGYMLLQAADSYDYYLGFSFLSNTAALVLLSAGLLFYLARRAQSVRLVLAYGLPLVLGAISWLFFTKTAVYYEYDYAFQVFFSSGLWGMQGFSLFNPLSLAPDELLAGGVGLGDANLLSLNSTGRFALLMSMQVGLIVVSVEFARDAIRRRKWGAGMV